MWAELTFVLTRAREMKLYVLFMLCLSSGYSMFEDQAGKFDWHQQYVGHVSYLEFDQSTQKRILVATDAGVLASISARTGDIVWRQVLEPGLSLDTVLQTKAMAVSVSGGGVLLRAWDLHSGRIKWETATEVAPANHSYSLSAGWRPGGVHMAAAGNLVLLVSGPSLSAYIARTGDRRWTNTLAKEGMPSAVYVDDGVLYVMLVNEGVGLTVARLNATNGEQLAEQNFKAPWLSSATSCILDAGHVTCVEASRLDMFHAALTADSSFSLTLLPSLGVQSGSTLQLMPAKYGHVWLRVGHAHYLLALRNDHVTLERTLKAALPLVGSLDADHVTDVQLDYSEEGWLSVECEGGEGKVQLAEQHGRPAKAVVYIFTKPEGDRGYRVAVVMEDHTLLLIQHGGHVAWQREEALASIEAVEMMDLPAADQSESTESFIEFSLRETNPLKLLARRLRLQLGLAGEFIGQLREKGVNAVIELTEETGSLVRDHFNIRKLILAATANGKLYAVDSGSGAVIWQSYHPNILPFKGGRPLLYLLRTTSHPPQPPLAVLLGQSNSDECTGSLLLSFNPLTGESSDTLCLPPLLQATLLPATDAMHSKILLLLSDQLEVHAFPSSPVSLNHPVFVFTGEPERITGHVISHDYTSAQPVWYVKFPSASERVLTVTSKRANEHVSSQGRVGADRSVEYKYLNPNLVAVVTESVDALKPYVSVYLLDSVSGSVVYHTTHKLASGPVHIVLSENWAVYQYYNTKQRRHEMAVLELYDRHGNQTHTVWSSLSPPATPQVLSQSYVIPTSITTLTTTHTLKGITHKNILMGLHSGHIATLPKAMMDPRRLLEVSNTMKEEGIPPYVPAVPIRPVLLINYNQTVARIHSIHTAPSGLESTSIVFACGLDLYLTRVTPSKQFDMLAEDFDFRLVATVTLAMIVGTLVLSYLSAWKTLKAVWT